jgi:intraflagellar transport protein 81
MEQISFIVDRLNAPPFNKGYNTLTEVDAKSSLELLDLVCEVIANIDKDQESIMNDQIESRINRIIQFLILMKFNLSNDQVDDFREHLLNGDKDVLHSILLWCLQRFEHLQKRAYLAKYLLPLEIPADFMGETLVIELSQTLKALQGEFKDIHKTVEQLRSSGAKPSELKAEIVQLEQEKTQLQNKLQRMKRDFKGDEASFQEMLQVTSALRKEQEEEIRIYERMRTYRQSLEEAELRLSDATRRLTEMKSNGMQNLSAEQLLAKLQKDVQDINEKRERLESNLRDREGHFEKISGAGEAYERNISEDDVRNKREQKQDLEDQVASLQDRLNAAIDRNDKLVVFRQASTLARKKLREREDEVDKLLEEKRRIKKQMDDKEAEAKANSKGSGKHIGKMDLQKYGAIVKEKIDKYKRMRDELSSLRSELVILQRTEQLLKNKSKNLEEFLTELERKKGIEGYRNTQRALVEMTEKTAAVDQMKSSTLDEISAVVDSISKEFKARHAIIAPVMAELKVSYCHRRLCSRTHLTPDTSRLADKSSPRLNQSILSARALMIKLRSD